MSDGQQPDLAHQLRQLQQDVAGLGERIARLELARLDERPAAARAATQPTAGAAAAPAPGAAAQLTWLAITCFVLCGALALRTATHARWITPLFGVGLGFGYCLALLGLAQLLARRAASAQVVALRFCGALLPPLIALESVRAQTLSAAHATVALGGCALVALAIAALRRAPGLAAAALLGSLVAAAGIGFTAVAVGGRAALVAGAGVAALWLAHRQRWAFLRPLLLVPAAALLGGALLLSARRLELAAAVPALLLCTLGLWLAIVLSCALRRAQLDAFERALPPLATLWAFGALALAAPALAPWAGAALSIAALAAVAAALRGSRAQPAQLGPFAVAAALLAGCALPWLEASGVALACFAVELQLVALWRRALLRRGPLLPQALLLLATASAFGRAGLHAQRSAFGLALGALLAALALLLYALGARGRLAAPTAGIAPLLCAALLLYAVLAGTAAALGLHGATLQLAQTLLLAALASVAAIVGRRFELGAAALVGRLGIGLLALKVVALDLGALRGGQSVLAVAALGATALAAGLTRRRATRA